MDAWSHGRSITRQEGINTNTRTPRTDKHNAQKGTLYPSCSSYFRVSKISRTIDLTSKGSSYSTVFTKPCEARCRYHPHTILDIVSVVSPYHYQDALLSSSPFDYLWNEQWIQSRYSSPHSYKSILINILFFQHHMNTLRRYCHAMRYIGRSTFRTPPSPSLFTFKPLAGYDLLLLYSFNSPWLLVSTFKTNLC